MDITSAWPRQEYGDTNGNQPPLSLLLTISGLNILDIDMQTISSRHSKNPAWSQQIGWGKICRYWYKLGLHQTDMLHNNGWVHQQHTSAIYPWGPKKPEHLPQTHQEITYGAKEQLATDCHDTSPIPILDSTDIKQVKGIIGSLLYYAWAVDNKLLIILSAIGPHQAGRSYQEHTRGG